MKIQLFGIPSFAGALYPGTELAPDAIRKAGLVESLQETGRITLDYGNIIDGSDLPRHNVGPVRNWPAPRMVWEAIQEKAEMLFSPEAFSIILGGDCSIEVGTFSAFRKVFGEQSHLLVLDGHIDTIEPSGDRCFGAAGMGLWFLTQDQKVWWKEEPISVESISVLGPHGSIDENHDGIKVVPFEGLTFERAAQHLKEIPSDANILVHFDVDVLHESVMPAAYSLSKEGLGYDQAASLLKLILNDPRVKGIEITEFSADKDQDGACAKTIVELLRFSLP
ncbi:arginase family protein [Pseudoneobacillus sp. C159]